MPRRPEIGTIQLYPNRPLKATDKNGYVLKFYCPLQRKRIRRNCGTRDRREARRILRECRDRLLNGDYVASGGAITAEHAKASSSPHASIAGASEGRSWEDCWERYRRHLENRLRPRSVDDARYAIQIAEQILRDRAAKDSSGLRVADVMTLDHLELLQDRLLAGDHCRFDSRSPNTVNSMMAAIMAFVRYCNRHNWIDSVPPVEKLDVDEVMKGRPITVEEFERMLAATSDVVGIAAAESWQFAIRVLWESGFRLGDLMDFSWDDERRIHPRWSKTPGVHPTIMIPSTQKNGLVQEIPLLPGLRELLERVPVSRRTGWVVNPVTVPYTIAATAEWFQPTTEDLQALAGRYSNRSIAAACGVTDTAVRKWLKSAGIRRTTEFQRHTGAISQKEIAEIRRRSLRKTEHAARRAEKRQTREQVGRVISRIGEAAGIIVKQVDENGRGQRKYASAHDLRRGCAQRLINQGVSAETLKVVMRHSSFQTTERYYGAFRAAQAAATELATKSTPGPIVGGLMGGEKEVSKLTVDEIEKLKSLLKTI